jgi:hypothetical protein
MTTTKIRTTIAILAAAFAVAVATGPIVPAAHALDNNTVATEATCDAAWNQFAAYVRLAKEADDRGEIANRNYYLDQAREIKDAAKRSGCDWAAFRAAIVDRLGGRVGGGLPTVQTGDSPTTGSTAVSPVDAPMVGTIAP